jgi:phosphoribosylglycinamide formyltransferase-1
MSKMPVAVLVSGSGSNLQALIDHAAAGSLPIDIQHVITNRADSYALTRAKDAGIPTTCIDHKPFKKREDFDRVLLDAVRQTQVELVMLAGFMRILTAEFVAPLSGKLINLHPSLLPKYPGLDPHSKALEAGDSRHGATVHFVNEELDAGPIIMQGSLCINENDDATSLRKRVQLEVEHRIVPLTIKWYAQRRIVMEGEHVLLDGKPLPAQGYQYDGDAL